MIQTTFANGINPFTGKPPEPVVCVPALPARARDWSRLDCVQQCIIDKPGITIAELVWATMRTRSSLEHSLAVLEKLGRVRHEKSTRSPDNKMPLNRFWSMQ